MYIRRTTQLVILLSIFILIFGHFGCERVNQVLNLQTETVTPIAERDHLWPIDQNGVEVPVPGTWLLVSQTHPNSIYTIGDSFTLPPDNPHRVQISEGIYTDSEGILWTKAKITTFNGDQLQFLERVDTSVTPHQLHAVFTVDENGIPILEYAAYPFELPKYNVQIWEKQ